MSGDESPSALTIAKGRLSGWSVDGNPLDGSVSPWWPISITQAQFDTIQQFGIDIDESAPFGALAGCSIAQLYSILINDNDFESYFTTNHANPDGIIISGAPDQISGGPTTFQDDLRQDITVTNNTFEHTCGATAGSVEAAIQFINTTGDIGYNSITSSLTSDASEYAVGIWNHGVGVGIPLVTPTTWTFICDNTIAGATTAGLSTDNYIGYVKIDTIFYCATGHLSGANDAGHIDFSGYAYNIGSAYSGSSNSATDITGVHHPSAPLTDNPAYDIFTNNNSGGTQISLSGSSGATVFLGQAGPGSGSWSFFGDNDIEGSTDVASVTSVSLVDVSNNYWGGGSFVGTNVTYTGGTGLSSQDISRGFVCSSGLTTHEKGNLPLSIPLGSLGDTNSMTHCDSLLSNGYDYLLDGQMEQSYDTLRLFLEQCPFYMGNKYNGGVPSWEAFIYAGSAFSGWTQGGVGRFPDFMSWLKKVLYYNPDTNWYCNDVDEMLTAAYSDETVEVICEYIIQSGKCPGLAAYFQETLTAVIQDRHKAWLDSLGRAFMIKEDSLGMEGPQLWADSIGADTLAHPFTDTTVPTLFQDSLEILLGPQYASSVGASSPISSQALLSVQLLENPMKDEIDVSYEMGRTALVTMELRDVLGRAVPIANAKYQLEQPGSHTAAIPAPNLPPGVYYLRVTTDVGDAITLKIVKQ
jgi:hypothetical protein